jgi:hypothetical protein
MENERSGNVGFSADVKPLFRETDRTAMEGAFDLWSYDDVVRHAPEILSALSSGSMPCDGAWPAERVAIVRRWIEAGTPP